MDVINAIGKEMTNKISVGWLRRYNGVDINKENILLNCTMIERYIDEIMNGHIKLRSSSFFIMFHY